MLRERSMPAQPAEGGGTVRAVRCKGGADVSHKRNGEYKTQKDEWETPQWLFDMLDREFKFSLDPAASIQHCNAKCKIFMTDALEEDWKETIRSGRKVGILGADREDSIFLNPPYSAGNIDKFMAKAWEESQKGAVVVCLVPCATDTKWWHNYSMKAQEIRFIKGRVKFIGYDTEGKQIKNSPKFSSCVVIFDQKLEQRNVDATRIGEYVRPRIGKTIEQPREART